VTERFRHQGIDLVHIRSPNDDKPLAGCDAGKLIYVFADGLTAVCPYLVFAARTPQSHYPDTDFLVGNILDGEVTGPLDDYDLAGKLRMGTNATCTACSMNAACGKGCPAALISRGQTIGEAVSPAIDAEPSTGTTTKSSPRETRVAQTGADTHAGLRRLRAGLRRMRTDS
jgi:radical SAM protein with 4Fe4S-binding SPASM domain